MNRPDSRTSAKTRRSSWIRGAYCALTSTWGIGGTASQCRRPAFSDKQSCCKRQDSGGDCVVDEAEVPVEGLPAPADPPADTGERERPGRGADERQRNVAVEPHPEHSGGERAGQANARRPPPEHE